MICTTWFAATVSALNGCGEDSMGRSLHSTPALLHVVGCQLETGVRTPAGVARPVQVARQRSDCNEFAHAVGVHISAFAAGDDFTAAHDPVSIGDGFGEVVVLLDE